MHQPPGAPGPQRGAEVMRIVWDPITNELKTHAGACEIVLCDYQLSGKQAVPDCVEADIYTVTRATRDVEVIDAPTPCAVCVLRSVLVSFDWVRNET